MTAIDVAKVWDIDCPPEHKLALLWIAEDSSSDGTYSWWRYNPQRLYERTQLHPQHVLYIIDILRDQGVLTYDREMSSLRAPSMYLLDLDVWLTTPRYTVVREEEEEPAPTKTYHKKNVGGGLRRQVFERDAYRCQHCGGWEDLCADHVVPESKGGPTELDNLQTLCRSCNSRKGTRT